MKAVVCRDFNGRADVEDFQPPSMSPGSVRVDIRAAGVSFANTLVLSGQHQNTPPLPFIPGTEAAGVVADCSTDAARQLAPGTRVVLSLPHGSFCEQVVTAAQYARPIPGGMGFREATYFSTLYPTSYIALQWKARLCPGEVLLVHGASGGAGLTAVEIGKAMGATVIASAGGAAKAEVARSHGADRVIDHRATNVRDAVLDLTAGRGADVIYDPVGGETFDASLRCVAPDGRILSVGFASGSLPSVPANILLVKAASVMGVYWGYYMGWAKQRPPAETTARIDAAYAQLFEWHAAGLLRATIDRSFPLARFGDALTAVAGRDVRGKIVLDIDA